MFAKLASLARQGVSAVKAMVSKAEALAVAAVTGAVVSLGSMGSAHADVPAIVGTTVATMTTDATSIFTTVFPYVAAVLGMIVVLKLFKRFVNKA